MVVPSPVLSSRLVDFAQAVLWNGWGIAGTASTLTLLLYLSPVVPRRARLWVSGYLPVTNVSKRSIVLSVGFILILVACFQAYDDVSARLRKSQSDLNTYINSENVKRDGSAARFVITDFGIEPILENTAKIPRYRWFYKWGNQGALAMIDGRSSGYTKVFDHLLSKDESSAEMISIDVLASKIYPDVNGGQAQPGQNYKVTFGEISEQENELIKSGVGFTYMFIAVKYLDDGLSSTKAHQAEICVYITKLDHYNDCPQANRIRTVDR